MTDRTAAAASGQLLTFELGGGEYALPVERVQEVLEHAPATRAPRPSRNPG